MVPTPSAARAPNNKATVALRLTQHQAEEEESEPFFPGAFILGGLWWCSGTGRNKPDIQAHWGKSLGRIQNILGDPQNMTISGGQEGTDSMRKLSGD